MKVKVIQLINNYYRDDEVSKGNTEVPLGMYCSFGYYDALQAETIEINGKSNSIYKASNRITIEKLDGTCNRHDLVCTISNEKKENMFWKIAQSYSYLFLTMIRVDHNPKGILKPIVEGIAQLNKDRRTICYSSYEQQSEVIVLRLENSYFAGVHFVEALNTYFNILKTYSIFSVKECILESYKKICGHVQKERVRIQIQAMVKNKSSIDGFLEKLWEKIREDENDVQCKPVKYATLGSADFLIELESVSMQKLLSCYRMGEILTHTNPLFSSTFYNLETQILPEKEIMHCGTVDE